MARELTVWRFKHGALWNFSYLVGAPGDEAVVVDPGGDVAAIMEAARGAEMRIVSAVLTHGHRDHLRGLPELLQSVEAEVFAHRAERELLVAEFDGGVRLVDDGTEIAAGGTRLAVVHTPGHTPGSLTLWGEGVLFTGDTLMVSGPGRHGHEEGSEEALRESVERRLRAVPRETVVYPGHDEGPEPFAPLGRILGL